MSGADNQQERLTAEAIPSTLGSFLSGFALGEGSFMLVCRRRADYGRKWKISAAFNVSQKDRAPLELFRETLGCGSIRGAGRQWRLVLGGQPPLRPSQLRRPVLRSVSARWAEGGRIRSVQARGRASEPGLLERCRLRHCSRAQRRNEQWRKETLLGSENPQRLYADLSGEHGEMR